MSQFTLGSNGLLEYNSKHKVLICRDCEYAIQKGAVQSHLLRHKIYRGERQNLISTIETLDLREPDEVPLPEPHALPIASLPVLDGYRCKHNDCGNLCASVKRMRRHWADVHGRTNEFKTMATEVKMQTFFRGTKIQYFEVCDASEVRFFKTTPLLTAAHGALDLAVQMMDQDETDGCEESPSHSGGSEELPYDLDQDDGQDDDEDDDDYYDDCYDDDEEEEEEEDVDGDDDSGHVADVHNYIPSPTSALHALDLGALKTFHHFISSTSRSLPQPRHTASEPCYWQVVVLPLAFSCHWLMSGLLAVSAYHASTLSSDASFAEAYRSQALSFFADFMAGREEASRRKYGTIINPNNDDERRVGGQLMCILRCAHWALTPNPMFCQRFTSYPFKLRNFLTVMRSFTLVERLGDAGTPEEVFARANQIFQTRREEGCKDEGGALLSLLDTLPSRMSDVFGRPNKVDDVMATLAAIASLVEHYSVSYEVESGKWAPTAVWHGMVQWWSKVPDHFRYLVSRHDPSALVVMAHWVSAFVRRAEKSGHWFLSGLADRLHLEIDDQLRGSCVRASSLIGDLGSESAREALTH